MSVRARNDDKLPAPGESMLVINETV